jgi:hypothetical protein
MSIKALHMFKNKKKKIKHTKRNKKKVETVNYK